MLVKSYLTPLESLQVKTYIGVIIILAVILLACLIRAIKGPRIVDRIVSVNMMGTIVMVIIVVLSLLLKESYLVDIGLIYAMISFLAVVVITKVYIGVYTENNEKEDTKNGNA